MGTDKKDAAGDDDLARIQKESDDATAFLMEEHLKETRLLEQARDGALAALWDAEASVAEARRDVGLRDVQLTEATLRVQDLQRECDELRGAGSRMEHGLEASWEAVRSLQDERDEAVDRVRRLEQELSLQWRSLESGVDVDALRMGRRESSERPSVVAPAPAESLEAMKAQLEETRAALEHAQKERDEALARAEQKAAAGPVVQVPAPAPATPIRPAPSKAQSAGAYSVHRTRKTDREDAQEV